MGIRPHVTVKDGHLALGGVDLVGLAEEFGTPLYVTDEDRIRQRYREFRDAFKTLYPKVQVCYACKANSSLALLHILRQEGAGADILSEGELFLVQEVGIAPEKVIFTGNNKTDRELEAALEAGVTINLDALHEMERLVGICKREDRKARVSFRVNPAVDPATHPHLSTGLRESKFGIPEEEVEGAYRRAMESGYLDIAGIHMHIGSQITTTSPYEEATSKLFDMVGMLKRELGLDLDFVDIGGGVGIRYQEDKPYITPADLAGVVVPIIKDKVSEHGLKEPVLYLEPGRYIVGDSAVMLTRVSTIKRTPHRTFIGTDAGFHVLARPTLYGSYHEVVVASRAEEAPAEKVDIAGNVCESGDILARDRMLPKIHAGDVLAFLDAGAYGFIMASQYNSRPRPAEILVHQGKYELIRERETFQDLVRHQRVPERLEKKGG
jgi:diaminopimelate decarboxylase